MSETIHVPKAGTYKMERISEEAKSNKKESAPKKKTHEVLILFLAFAVIIILQLLSNGR